MKNKKENEPFTTSIDPEVLNKFKKECDKFGLKQRRVVENLLKFWLNNPEILMKDCQQNKAQ
ncbi:MAG: hypothetical protein QW818_02570 [Candidatus Aenigmatarchaeota archaeon]